jgi:hypothetical protein
MVTSTTSPKSEYFTPCGESLGELTGTDTQHLLSLLLAKCSACASIKKLEVDAGFDQGKGDFAAECDGVPSFLKIAVEV